METNQELNSKLDRISKLLAIIAVGEKDFKEQVRILNNAEFQPKEIATLLGKTANNVSVTLNSIKKGKGGMTKSKMNNSTQSAKN